MGNTLKQLKRSSQFMIGFGIFAAVLLMVIIYPLVVAADPLEMVGQGIFYKPGTYVSAADTVTKSISSDKSYVLNIDTSANRLSSRISADDRKAMVEWLEKYGDVAQGTLDTSDDGVGELLDMWNARYDASNPQKGLIAAKKKYYARLDSSLKELMKEQDIIIAATDEEGNLREQGKIADNIYVNVKDVPNQRTFLLGTI